MAEKLSDKRQRFQAALDLFISRLSEDRCVLAAVLVGSLTEDTVWSRENLFLWVIEIDGVTKRLKSDGEDEDITRILVEDDINLYCEIIPRSRFKKMVEGVSRTSFSCNFFAERRLVYCDDPSIKNWFDMANKVATKDKEKELLVSSSWAIHAVKHCRKLLDYKKDETHRIRDCLLWGAHSLAAIEIIRAGQIYEHYLMYRAVELNPELFQVVYLDLINGKPTKKKILTALERIEGYLEEHAAAHLKPITTYLKKQKRLVPMSEISENFAYSQIYPWHIESVCEWLRDYGYVEKLSAPFKLTKKSRVDVEEPAYQYN